MNKKSVINKLRSITITHYFLSLRLLSSRLFGKLLLFTCLATSFVFPTFAKPETKTVHIVVFGNQKQPPLFEDLMELVKTKLQNYDVDLKIIDDQPETKHDLDQYLLVTMNSKDESILISSLAASRDYYLTKSPILYPNYISPTCCHGGIYVLFNHLHIDEDNMSDIVSYIIGLGLYQIGDYEGCEQSLKESIDIVAKNSLGRTSDGIKEYINFYRANCAIMRDELKTAAFLIQTSPILTEEASINLAWIELKIGNTQDALDLLDKQAEWKDWDFLKRRAQLYNLAFRYDDAVANLNAAIELSPIDPILYTLRGQTYLLLYQWDNVLADYNKAIELDPTYADAYFYRGVLYYSILQTGQAMYTDALTDFQRYLDLAPDGEHAAEATRYATDIQTQINALNN